MTREPSAGSFEHLVKTVDVVVADFVRLSLQPATEPYWGRRGTHRFDDPAKVFGVLYLGDTLGTAFAESVIHDNGRFDPPTGRYQVSLAEFCRAVTAFSAPSGDTLRLADLSGDNLKALGLNADLCAGSTYTTSQAWARAIHDRFPGVAGIRYPSRQRPGCLCVALFERSGVSVSAHRPLHASERIALCKTFNVEVV